MARLAVKAWVNSFLRSECGGIKKLTSCGLLLLEKIALLANFLDLSGMNDLSMTHDDSRDLV